MAKYNTIESRQSSHLMIYGDNKSGKSTLVSQLAEHGFHLYWFSLDGGHSVLSKLSDRAKDNIDIFILPDTPDNPIGIITCSKVITGGMCRICDTHGQVSCSSCQLNNRPVSVISFKDLGLKDIVVFDHVSQLDKSAINYVLKNVMQKRNKEEDYKFEFEDWRKQGLLINNFFSNVQQAKFNIVCIAQIIEVALPDGTKKLVPEIGTRNVSATSGQYFDHMVLTTVVNGAHGSGSSSVFNHNAITGSRTDVCIEKLEVASLVSFFENIPVQRLEKELQGSSLTSSSSSSEVKSVETTKEIDDKKLLDNLSYTEKDELISDQNSTMGTVRNSSSNSVEHSSPVESTALTSGKSKLEEIRARIAASQR